MTPLAWAWAGFSLFMSIASVLLFRANDPLVAEAAIFWAMIGSAKYLTIIEPED